MNTDMVRMLVDYNYWANRRVWECVMTLTDEQFTQDFDYSIGSVHAQLVHQMNAEAVWYFRMRSESLSTRYKPEDFPTRRDVRLKWNVLERDIRSFVESLTDDELTREFQYFTTAEVNANSSILAVLLHLVNHGTDHRAQILSLLHHFGAPTVEQDLIFYMRAQALSGD